MELRAGQGSGYMYWGEDTRGHKTKMKKKKNTAKHGNGRSGGTSARKNVEKNIKFISHSQFSILIHPSRQTTTRTAAAKKNRKLRLHLRWLLLLLSVLFLQAAHLPMHAVGTH